VVEILCHLLKQPEFKKLKNPARSSKDKLEETKESTDAQDKAGSMVQEYWDIYRKNETLSRQTLDLHRFGEEIGKIVHRIKRGDGIQLLLGVQPHDAARHNHGLTPEGS
jgi:hypothetical protein